MPSHAQILSRCCKCGATSYRRVIARDQDGAMRASNLYKCSGCSVVFRDPKEWRGEVSDNQPSSLSNFATREGGIPSSHPHAG